MDIASRFGGFGGMTERVKGLADRGKELAEKSKSMLKPPPVIFGAPRQIATDAETSWWHVPVFIRPQAMHRKTLERCRVTLVSCDGGGSSLNMRWRTLDGKPPVPQMTLVDGQLYLVPVAARKESGSNRVAIITNESFLAEKKVKMQVPAGRSKWLLRVENDEDSWDSDYPYVLNVPPGDRRNGHFTLEVRYEGLE